MIELLKKLKEIDKGLTVNINGNPIEEEMIKTDVLGQVYIKMDPLLKKRFYGEGPLSEVNIQVRMNKGVIFSMTLSEFYPCCGKVLGWDLTSKDLFYVDSHPQQIEEGKFSNIFRVFIGIVEWIIKWAKYSSISFIVSNKQEVFHKLIDKISTYKVVNEFKNKRMDNQTTCLEYCRNVW